MAICKSMVKLLKGGIEVESEAGKYARFVVRLHAINLDEQEVLRESENTKTVVASDNPKKTDSDLGEEDRNAV